MTERTGFQKAVAHALDERHKTQRSLLEYQYSYFTVGYLMHDRRYPWFHNLTSAQEDDLLFCFVANSLGKPVTVEVR